MMKKTTWILLTLIAALLASCAHGRCASGWEQPGDGSLRCSNYVCDPGYAFVGARECAKICDPGYEWDESHRCVEARKK